MPRATPLSPAKPSSISRYLAARALVVLALMVVVAGVSILALTQIEQDSVRLADHHLPRFKAALHLSMDATAASAISVRMASATSQAERRSLLDRVAERHQAMEEHIAHLTEIGADDVTVAAVRRLRDSLMDGALALSTIAQEDISLRGSGGANGPDIAQRLAELERRRRNLILRQQDLSSELAGFVSALTSDAERRFDNQRDTAERGLDRSLLVVIACGLGAVGAVAWMYVGLRERVIGRVLRLRAALQDGGAQALAALPMEGNDEISQMTMALRALMDTIERRNAELEMMATTDALTGLSNRRHFAERAEDEINRARRYDSGLSLIIGDIDHFKSINDGWGHEVGDQALCLVAEIWRGQLRAIDLSARLGGEEFVALLPGADLAAALKVAERIRVEIANRALVIAEGGANVRLTISLGVATLRSGEDQVHLLRRADQAMYRAKTEGRNTVCVAA